MCIVCVCSFADAPLIIIKEKTVKKNGEITARPFQADAVVGGAAESATIAGVLLTSPEASVCEATTGHNQPKCKRKRKPLLSECK